MFCEKCGAQIDGSAHFCPACGASVPQMQGQQQMYGQPQPQPQQVYVQPAYVPPNGVVTVQKKDNAGCIVAAIIGVLLFIPVVGIIAAILVPSMMNYVKKSEQKTANANAKTAFNTVMTYVTDEETMGHVPDIPADQVIDCSEDGAEGTLQHELYKTFQDVEEPGVVIIGYYDGDSYSSDPMNIRGDEIFVQWSKSSSNQIFGQYPGYIDYMGNDDIGKGTFGEYYLPDSNDN